MKHDLNNASDKQKFLQDRINRNLVVRKIKDPRIPLNTLGDNMLTSLAELLESKEEQEYRNLLKQYRLRA